MSTFNHVLNWLCCCGAFEDVLIPDETSEGSDDLALARPLLDEDAGGYTSSSKDLHHSQKLNNILGFGRQNVRGDYELLEVLGEGVIVREGCLVEVLLLLNEKPLEVIYY